MKHALALLMVMGTIPAPAAPAEPKEAEAHCAARVAELSASGFRMGWRFGFSTKEACDVGEGRFVVPPGSGGHEVVFWVEADRVVNFRLLAADGRALAEWSSGRGEWTGALQLPAGAYRVKIAAAGKTTGAAYFGLKGSALPDIPLDTARWQEMPAVPTAGYRWPFLLRVPAVVRAPFILVAPNNTGFATADLEILRADAANQGRSDGELAEALGCPLLIPLFPRPPQGERNLYLHALSREALVAPQEEWRRVDLQLLAMIDAAREVLAQRGTKVDSRVLLWGFSASGDFAQRVAILHPERVRAVAAGGFSWPLAPQAKEGGTVLPYPIGVGDLDGFGAAQPSAEALQAVRWLLFRGEKDDNEPLDYPECFSPEHAVLVRSRFGVTAAERWERATALYTAAGLNAEFVLEPDAGHLVTAGMRARVERFFATVVGIESQAR
ncbi:MAG: hypothetical protein IPL39_24665 [Opitutaceae bacterium]|nr:hypothetical protein [Opitutaceae bacterium]